MKSKFLALACLSVIAFSAQAQMKVHILDVGQGSAAILEFPCGVIMIDTGGEINDEFNSTDSLTKQMDKIFKERGNKIIDLLILTHPHKDHTLGVKEILKKKYKIKNVVTNGMTTGSGKAGQIAIQTEVSKSEATATTADDIGYYEAIAENIGTNGVTNAVIDPINCPGTNPVVTLLWGRVNNNTDNWTATEFANANNHSVVCRIDYGESSILFTGDIETDAIESILKKYQSTSLLDADVYVASHHGAKNGTTKPFAEKISPEIAIMSFGDPDRQVAWTAWAYGHPNKGIVEVLSEKVSKTRPEKFVMVGDGKENFSVQPITAAVYGIGWDGTIDLVATKDGAWTPTESKSLLNVNTATLVELKARLPIKSTVAKAIVAHRSSAPFATLADLDNVPGIGPATLGLISGLIKFHD